MRGVDAVITGLGVVAPTGLGVQPFWEATSAGRSGLGPLTKVTGNYGIHVAGEISGFDDTEVPERLLTQTDRTTRLSLVASEWALTDAALDPSSGDDFAVGTALSCAVGGFEFGQRELQKLWGSGGEHVSGYQSFAWFYAVNTGQVSIRHGLRGPGAVLVSEQAGGLDSIGYARRQVVRSGGAVLAGGVEAPLCPWGLTAQSTAGLFNPGTDPTTTYLPFDVEAGGSVPGEGGAVVVVESSAAARARGATAYAGVAGWGSTFDGVDERPGGGLARAASAALRDAELVPGDVDVVFADGAGARHLDDAEADALVSLFGAGAVPVTVPKAGTGRLNAGGSALDVACAALALRHQLIPPTVNTTRPDPRLDLVLHAPRRHRLRVALVLARGHGGFNSALVLHEITDTEETPR